MIRSDCGGGRQRINGEPLDHVHRLQSRPQIKKREQMEHLDRSRRREYALDSNLVMLPDFAPQLVARAVGIAIQLRQRRLDCLYSPRRRPQRILVRRQLNRIVVVNSEFALELLNRLARLVRSKRGDRWEYEILSFDQSR